MKTKLPTFEGTGLSRRSMLRVGALGILGLALSACGEASSVSRSAPASGLTVQQLVDAAKKEGQLNLTLQNGVRDVMQEAIEAFKKHYSLQSLQVNATIESDLVASATKAVTEARTGIAPTTDVVMNITELVASMIDAGALATINGWQSLLPEGATDTANISPGLFNGLAFRYSESWFGAAFNSDLIQASAMPPTLKDIGDSKYAGKFATRDYPTQSVQGALVVYGQDPTLSILRTWGQNKPVILETTDAMQRMGLGDVAFVLNVSEQVAATAMRGNAKIQRHYFRDVVPKTVYYHAVRKGAQHVNGATLFVLWAAGPEAEAIWSKTGYSNTLYPQSRGIETKKRIDALGAKLVGWEDNQESFERLRWYSLTDEGKQFQAASVKAVKEGK